MPSACSNCGCRLYRTTKDHPDAKKYGGHGLCATCYYHRERPATGRTNAAPYSDPGQCRYCNRPMRRSRERKADRPNTVCVAGQGMCVSCRNTWAVYGLHPDDWTAMLIAQSGRCDVCLGPMRKPVVDHCHDSGVVRSLLCSNCNAAEGMLLGDPARARALANYMERHKKEEHS